MAGSENPTNIFLLEKNIELVARSQAGEKQRTFFLATEINRKHCIMGCKKREGGGGGGGGGWRAGEKEVELYLGWWGGGESIVLNHHLRSHTVFQITKL